MRAAYRIEGDRHGRRERRRQRVTILDLPIELSNPGRGLTKTKNLCVPAHAIAREAKRHGNAVFPILDEWLVSKPRSDLVPERFFVGAACAGTSAAVSQRGCFQTVLRGRMGAEDQQPQAQRHGAAKTSRHERLLPSSAEGGPRRRRPKSAHSSRLAAVSSRPSLLGETVRDGVERRERS